MAEPVVAAGTSTAAFHRVRRGETISEIADEYGVTQRELLAWNGLDRPGRIRIGQRHPGGLARGARRADAPMPRRMGAPAKTHIVRRGETLKGLAKRYGVSIQALREANGLSERETLKAGYRAQDSGLAHRRHARRIGRKPFSTASE